ncbi:hypothetical protein [Microbacterium sp. NPDC076911]|uniref:hypothetical protein n=1 Tax=Microbacterium sp. NPDC076911 TaxID=3154958 RepID=UPI0034304EB5
MPEPTGGATPTAPTDASANDGVDAGGKPPSIERSESPDVVSRSPWLGRIGLIAVLLGLVGVIAIQLGPALIGVQTFSAMDRLMAVSPWWNGGTAAPVLNPFLGDSIDALLPSYIQSRERLLSGDWPLWSPLAGGGSELLATTTHPTLTLSGIWFLILPAVYAPGFVKLVEVAIAVAGMYLWMRRVGLSRPASAISGIFYAGSGFVVAWATWAGQSSVAVMIPALFWAVEYYLAKRTARAALPIALVVAFLLLGGFPAVAGHALYAGAIYFIVRLLADRGARNAAASWKLFAGGVAAVMLGIVLSAVQFLPFALSLSGTDLSARASQFFSEEPFRSFLSVFLPETFSDLNFGPGTNPIEAYAFVGMGAVFFAAVAVITSRPREQARGVVPFLAVAALLAAALVWQQGWWTDWMSELPIFSGNKSGRLRDIFGLSMAALAGIGVDRIFGRMQVLQRRRILVLAGISLVGFSALAVAVFRRFPTLPTRTLVLDTAPGLVIIALAVVAVIFARRAAVKTTAFVGIALLAALQMGSSVSNFWPLSDAEDFYPQTSLITELQAASGSERVLTSRTFMGSAASVYGIRSATGHAFQPDSWREYLVAVDIGAFSAGQTPTNPRVLFTGTETEAQRALLDRLSTAAWVTESGAEVPGELLTTQGTPITELPDATASVMVTPEQPLTVPIASAALRGVVLGLSEGVGKQAEDPTVTAEILDETGSVVASGQIVRATLPAEPLTIAIAGEDLAGASGLSLRVTSNTDLVLQADSAGVPLIALVGAIDDGLVLDYADAHGNIWLRESALPRIRWASGSEVVTDSDQRLARLADPMLADDVVILSEPGPNAGGGGAELVVLEDGGDLIQVSVVAETDGYLVVADGMQDGWKVQIDGEPADLVDADHAFSAVLVPEGTHEITFEYTGQGVVPGATLTGVGLLVVVAVLLLSWRRARRTAEPVSAPVAVTS